MKTFFYGVKLGAGLVAGKVLITAAAFIMLRSLLGKEGLDYILGKGPKPSWMKPEETKSDEPAE